MTKDSKNLFWKEVNLFRQARRTKNYSSCFRHLGRAHIISQQGVLFHLYTHYLMLLFAFYRLDLKEIVGQVLRLVVTIPGHLLGRVPYGNIGWSAVGLTEEMPLPDDLRFLFEKNYY